MIKETHYIIVSDNPEVISHVQKVDDRLTDAPIISLARVQNLITDGLVKELFGGDASLSDILIVGEAIPLRLAQSCKGVFGVARQGPLGKEWWLMDQLDYDCYKVVRAKAYDAMKDRLGKLEKFYWDSLSPMEQALAEFADLFPRTKTIALEKDEVK